MVGRHPALEAIGQLPDAEIDLAAAAVQLGRIRAPEADWRAALAHLSELAREAARIGRVLEPARLEARIGALAGLLHARHDYAGDTERYDDLDNANLIRVIARRRGLPVSLGILWLHCVRAAGWIGRGLDVPGHFLIQVDGRMPSAPAAQGKGMPGGSGEAAGPRARAPRRQQVVVDAFSDGAMLQMGDLIGLIRSRVGEGVDLGPGIARPMGNRAVLLRLQRNVTLRLQAAGLNEAALDSLEGMIAIAPADPGLCRDAAGLNQRLGRTDEAIACLERFLALVPTGEAARGARASIDAMRTGRADG